ncbi:efflux RND transporter periplasmic adaptor subunit [Maribacter ulvicola]|uniref:Multidrug efflux pump subunit AcrA (Membrane-fusion protein) n=1 Tax=Maribacter ulvicola TaxID=228959 RepID=A0A1N6Z372_9FLAO|nr:efflux RND transporter periplasmic adaptor subunit [Maribacter ulvicola]SIR21284.1 Multidrug efflux pump subunit AcrA (membrane-fusion protein) [Maribacter ulvicola]
MRYLLISLVFLVFLSCGDKQEKVFPQKSELVSSVYASAIIQPDSIYKVYAVVAGILEGNLVEEGELVTKGDAILQVNNRTPKLNSENAYLTLQQSKENIQGNAAILKSIKDDIYAAELKFKNDSINFTRQKRLWDQNIGSKAEYDNQKLAYELSKNQLNQQKSSYERTKNDLETALQQAKNSYSSSKIIAEDYTINSKINGKVYALYKEPGELINTLEPLGAIGSATNFKIEMLIDEVDIIKIKLGQIALVTLDAYPMEVFKATVSKIYPQKDESSQTFKVEALFDSPPKVLYPGLAGEGNIVISKKADVVTIPRAYLVDGHKVITEDGTVTVEVGAENLERVEIISGITENDLILKPVE